ncbi:TPA: hypothetical protein RG418_001118 [Aeromonas hydrophila]|nr:hypothetical protein [Aeromonas hydrophila]
MLYTHTVVAVGASDKPFVVKNVIELAVIESMPLIVKVIYLMLAVGVF